MLLPACLLLQSLVLLLLLLRLLLCKRTSQHAWLAHPAHHSSWRHVLHKHQSTQQHVDVCHIASQQRRKSYMPGCAAR
jgi:hypothetical protein